MIAQAMLIDEAQFEKYEGMLEGLKRTSRFALLYQLLLVARRILLLYVAMFVKETAWLHIVLFMSSNLLFLIYLCALEPFIVPLNNYWHIMNEITCLAIAYLVACVNNPQYGPIRNVKMGEFIVYILFTSWALNFLLMLLITASETKLKCKRHYNRSKLREKCKKCFEKDSSEKEEKNDVGLAVELSKIEEEVKEEEEFVTEFNQASPRYDVQPAFILSQIQMIRSENLPRAEPTNIA